MEEIAIVCKVIANYYYGSRQNEKISMTSKIKPNELIGICIYLKTSKDYQINEKALGMLLAMFDSYNKYNYNQQNMENKHYYH